MKKGFTLIELLVVMGIFAVVGIVTAQSLFSVFTTSEKSESTVTIRENIETVFANLERELRNAKSLDSCDTVVNAGVTFEQIYYTDQDDTSSYFVCIYHPNWGYAHINGERLTTSDIRITSCSKTCELTSQSSRGSVDLSISAQTVGQSSSVTDSELNLSSFIQLRSNY